MALLYARPVTDLIAQDVELEKPGANRLGITVLGELSAHVGKQLGRRRQGFFVAEIQCQGVRPETYPVDRMALTRALVLRHNQLTLIACKVVAQATINLGKRQRELVTTASPLKAHYGLENREARVIDRHPADQRLVDQSLDGVIALQHRIRALRVILGL
ncbi:hypothetical protein D9M70_541840 [compost metagenome]